MRFFMIVGTLFAVLLDTAFFFHDINSGDLRNAGFMYIAGLLASGIFGFWVGQQAEKL